MPSSRPSTLAAMPLPFLGFIAGVAAAVAVAGGLEEAARLLQEGGPICMLSVVAGGVCAVAAGIVVGVGGPRPLSTALAATPWVGCGAAALLGASKVVEVIPMVSAGDRAVLAAAGAAEILSSVIVGSTLGAGALLGVAAAAALRGLMANNDDSAVDLAGGAVSLVVAGAAIWSVTTASWLRVMLMMRSSLSAADVAFVTQMQPSPIGAAGVVIAGLGVAGVVALAVSRGARARIAGAAPGLALSLLSLLGAASTGIVGGALPMDNDVVEAKLLVAEGSGSGPIAGSLPLARGATLTYPTDADGPRHVRLAVGDDVDADTLRLAVQGAEEAKLESLVLVTAPPPPPQPPTAVHPFLRTLDGVARGAETHFELCADAERGPSAIAVLGEVWGVKDDGEHAVITVGRGAMPPAVAPLVDEATKRGDTCLVVGDPALTLRGALILREAGLRVGLLSSRPTPPPATTDDDAGVGTLDKAAIQTVMRGGQRGIRACYERVLASEPSSQGKLTMRMTIGVDGRVSAVEVVSDTVESSELQRCVSARLAQLRFPRPNGGVVVVTYPFVFQPG